jgi:hypothetical protein
VVVVVAGDLWELNVLEALKLTFDLDLEGDFLRSGLAKGGRQPQPRRRVDFSGSRLSSF